MSLYNMLFGVHDKAGILLKCLGLTMGDIPRFRSCFIQDGMICIHTRTGGGNREFYSSEKTCRYNYPEYFDGTDNQPSGPWNEDLQKHPLYVSDSDDDFDCTYANFFFRYPEEYRKDLEALAENSPDYKPSEMWQMLFDSMSNSTTESNNGKKENIDKESSNKSK